MNQVLGRMQYLLSNSCVCMYVCIYVCMYVCTYVCDMCVLLLCTWRDVCLGLFVQVCIHVCNNSCISIHLTQISRPYLQTAF